MATTLKVLVNYVDADVSYVTTPADYIEMVLAQDYLIWTKGDSVVKDLATSEPTAAQLNAAAELIDPLVAVTVSKCLLMDYSHNVGGAYYTHLVKGMGEDKKYAFAFNFDNPTATEPQLEAWDTSAHTTILLNVLGAGFALNSMLNGRCTNLVGNGSWLPMAGTSNVILLNNTLGALLIASTVYANLKIVIPAAYATPAAETFVLTCRYTYF